MSAFTFAPASKAQRKARIALAGPSGSGKTYSALTLATTLADRVAVIDTERGSASLYSGPGAFAFDHLDLYTYSPDDLIRALAAAGAAGYGCVVVDSLSHFWSGEGGMLEQVDNAAKRSGGGNSFAGWKEARPMERRMIGALLGYPGHVIVTMRTKTEYVVEEDARGRKVPRKIGLKPEQRDGIEYEFDLVGDMDLENTLVVTKSRLTSLAGQVVRKPDADLGRAILAWLSEGVAVADSSDYTLRALDPDATPGDLRALHAEVKAAGLLSASVLGADDEPTTLGDLIVYCGHQATAKAARLEAAPADEAGSA